MNKLELLEILNNAIPADAKFTKIEIRMLASNADKLTTYQYLQELSRSEAVAGGAIFIDDDVSGPDFAVRIERR